VTDYEIQVAGPVGPVARSCLPCFTCTLVPRATVLAGTAASTEDLLGVINVLTTHRLTPSDIRINRDGSC
jgi:hypothetical protein